MSLGEQRVVDIDDRVRRTQRAGEISGIGAGENGGEGNTQLVGDLPAQCQRFIGGFGDLSSPLLGKDTNVSGHLAPPQKQAAFGQDSTEPGGHLGGGALQHFGVSGRLVSFHLQHVHGGQASVSQRGYFRALDPDGLHGRPDLGDGDIAGRFLGCLDSQDRGEPDLEFATHSRRILFDRSSRAAGGIQR